jgi:hypothetical protein
MALGEKNQCWVCWELKAYEYQEQGKGSFNDFKQRCFPVRGKGICDGIPAWLCKECLKNFKK